VSTIADWLASLGLPEYEQRFADNDVEIDVLPELTDQDLEKLGVSLGHRRRMLRAIRDLGQPAAAARPPPPAPVTAEPPARDKAERRQLAVMFCDLIGSTRCRLGSTPRTSGALSTPITAAVPSWSNGTAALS
jgi:hypothetical protein